MQIDDRILELFKKEKGIYHSGEEISNTLGISRQALWKHIEKLREMGYTIEAVPHLGYKLIDIPDKILVPEIKWNLRTNVIGKEISFFESLGSTNDKAYRLAEEGACEGTVVIADEQTKGKGRLGRRWCSPANTGIYLSCILRPRLLPNEVPKITLVAAISAVKAIREFSGINAMIKWPNDIIIADKKAGGILTELKGELDGVDFVILGVGINVNTSRKVLPEGATSLKEESKSTNDFSRVELIRIFLQILDGKYSLFCKKGFSTFRAELKSYSCTLGRYVEVTTSDKKKFRGRAIGINANGALVVEKGDGSEETFLSGDVMLIR